MNTFIFLRHGHSAANKSGTLTGQLPGIGLSPEGRKQATELITRIGKSSIDCIHMSPIHRCQLTLEPWLNSRNSSTMTKLSIDDGFSEIDFGDWSGRKLSSLRRLPLWKAVQNAPSTVTFPGGESFKKAQKRATQSFDSIRAIRGDKTHLIVSHSDTIKLVVAAAIGMKLDDFQKLEISPASFTVFRGDAKRISLLTINNSGSLSEILKKP
ncbi:MAG: histidine phosphatase family protein [Candidatus Planktophila sp.]